MTIEELITEMFMRDYKFFRLNKTYFQCEYCKFTIPVLYKNRNIAMLNHYNKVHSKNDKKG